ncbi:AraC family transcriptional regulator [Sphingobacterium mizutaii]|uniref:AraC family transcriptional regulator n=1 Tax=Sphingobacterium mizutaii TaxID=1010 RepID=UPI001627E929|nr:AraC family transcriptional regulator [Sphingobacterium mizutaii]
MKPIQYNVPVPKDRTVFVQEDILDKFYPYMHRHVEYQIIMIVAGSGQLLVDDNLHNFQQGDIFLVGSNQAHVFKNDQSSEGIRSVSVFFNLEGALLNLLNLPELSVLMEFISNNCRGFQVPNQHLAPIRRRIEVLKRSDRMDQLVNFFYLLKSLNMVSADLTPLSGVSHYETDGFGGFKINSLCRFIEENFKENISLCDVAEKANLTPQAFCRYFKKCTGKTFVSYLNEIRVREACRLLGNDKYDCVSIIAYSSGFNSITNFNRVFRSVIGTSPKEYALNYKNFLYQ